MPFILALLSGLAAIAIPLLTRLLISLGVGYVTYKGVSALFNSVEDQIMDLTSTLGADVINLMGLLNVDKAITIFFSAISIRLVFAGLTATGALTRMQWKTPTPAP